MPLMDALRSGVDLVNASKAGVSSAALAKYAYPLTESQLKISQAQAQYAPLLAQAQAASQLAYAQFLPRQILAQVLSNPALVQSMTKEQIQQMVEAANNPQSYMPGQGGSPMMPPPQQSGGLAGGSQDFGAANRASDAEVNYIAQNGNSGLAGGSAMTPQSGMGGAPQASQGVPPPQSQQVDTNAVTGTDPNSEIGRATTAWMNSPEAYAQAKQEGFYSIPDASKLLSWYRSKGQPSVNPTGGLSATPPGLQVNAPQGDWIDRLKQRTAMGSAGDTMTGGGKGVGGGTTYVDPQTQEARSSVTPTEATNIQTSLLTSERVKPYIEKLPEAYEKIYGLPNLGKMLTEGVVSYATGGNIDTPTLQSLGEFQSSLTNAADGFLKELNLNNTTGNRISMQEAIQPIKGENPKNYRARMDWLWKTIEERDEKGKAALAHGILLNPQMVQSIDGIKKLDKQADKWVMTIETPGSAPSSKVLTYNPKTRRLE